MYEYVKNDSLEDLLYSAAKARMKIASWKFPMLWSKIVCEACEKKKVIHLVLNCRMFSKILPYVSHDYVDEKRDQNTSESLWWSKYHEAAWYR